MKLDKMQFAKVLGEALVEVARNAHRAEMKLAGTINFDDEPFPG